ncbi:MAG: 3-oxoacyl-[acyl-carrier-protein] reductase [Ignavibacteriales bacterium]|nr:3-oxoacyl-[acyl-carrier-protein] reductase [Ignavibacteriales bacterium]
MKNRVAVVTGGAQGIGKAIVMGLASNGANVVIADMNEEGVNQTKKDVESLGAKALGVKCNVSDVNDIDNLVKKTMEIFSTIDILVNNAGVTRDNLMMRMDEKDWDLVLSVNLKGPFLLTKAVTHVMMKQRYGRIVKVSSVVGLMGNAGQANYAASKGGLISLTKSVAKEFASRNITCNAVAPGFIETSMTEKLQDKVKESYIKAIPLNRFGTPNDVANAVLFLSSEESGYITGQIIGIDGGMFMR